MDREKPLPRRLQSLRRRHHAISGAGSDNVNPPNRQPSGALWRILCILVWAHPPCSAGRRYHCGVSSSPD
jgi:hypothetical protein